MLFEKLSIDDSALVNIEPHEDDRGYFARTYCRKEFARAGLNFSAVQESVSVNDVRGTVRGMHFQWPPSREAKLVRCTRGLIYDVLLDMRPESESYLQHQSIILDASDHSAVYIPPGVAHGFQTLENDVEVFYVMSDYYAPELATTVRWNDATFEIPWPLPCAAISDKDRLCPSFSRQEFERELQSHAPANWRPSQ